MDRVINQIYSFVRGLKFTTFMAIVGLVFVLGAYFVGIFLKANKKEASKVAKVSYLLMAMLMLLILVILLKIRG